MTEFSSSEGALLGCFIVCRAQRLEPDVPRVQSGNGEPSDARCVSSPIEAKQLVSVGLTQSGRCGMASFDPMSGNHGFTSLAG